MTGNKLQDYRRQDYFSFSGNSDILTVSCWDVVISRKSPCRAFTSSSPMIIAREIFQVVRLAHLRFQTLGRSGGNHADTLPPQHRGQLHRFIPGNFAETGDKNLWRRHQRTGMFCRSGLKQFFQCRWRSNRPCGLPPAFQSGRHNARRRQSCSGIFLPPAEFENRAE